MRAVIGKGGMGAKTLAALQKSGAVYLNAIGGAAQFYARTVEKVLGVHLIEFGIPEAMWHLRVNNFAAIVTMDAHGNSLHADVGARDRREARRTAAGVSRLLELRFVSGQVAQLVERSPEKAGVGGSIPSLATTFSITYSLAFASVCSISFQNPIRVCQKLDSIWNGADGFCPVSKHWLVDPESEAARNDGWLRTAEAVLSWRHAKKPRGRH